MARLHSHVRTWSCLLMTLLVYFLDKSSASPGLDDRGSALFIFGDSTVDAGNNNYIDTIPENRADYMPYGRNGFFESPTGRFSDGRVIVDYIADYAKLPLIPSYLQPSVDYTKGVNFASGGAGVLPETNQGMVIDIPTQIRNFEEVIKSLKEKLGEAEAEKLVAEAVYFISVGSNDYMGGYLGNSKMRDLYGPEDYVGMVVGNLTQAIQVLYEKGARKFAFLSLGPLGCLPALRAANLKAGDGTGGCLEAASALALAHSNAFKGVLTSLEYLLKGFKYCNSDFFDWLNDRIRNPSAYGFKEGESACCGTGPYGGIFTCGGTKNVGEYTVCDSADDHIWWDSFHPTERIHEQFAKALWDGPPESVGPYQLRDLFFDKEKLTVDDVVDDYPGGEHLNLVA